MSQPSPRSLLAAAVLAGALVPAAGQAAEPRRVSAASAPEARDWQARIEVLQRAGSLGAGTVRIDSLMPDRQHVRYPQLHKGVPVVGGDLVAQLAGYDAVSVFGT